MRAPLALLSSLLAAAFVVVACGAGGGSPSSPSSPSTSPGSAPEPAATTSQARRGVKLVKVGDFEAPVHVTAPPGDRRRVFVVEQGGVVRLVRAGRVVDEPFLDITSKVTSGGEQGLLSIAFAPDYAQSGLFYAYYTDRSGDQRVVEFKRSTEDRADPGSERLVLGMEDSESNHNGGLLKFGSDRLLYIGTGDGGGGGDRHGARGNAQNLGNLLGKILRIDPSRRSGGRGYAIPSSNVMASRRGARGEIYAYGLRNPWRFSFDRATDALTVADVGQNEIEEVNYVSKGKGNGANFGWRPFEGRARFAPGERAPGHVKPVIERRHSAGYCSITGGYVVRDRNLPGLLGRYVFGDFCEPNILSARLSSAKASGLRRTGLRVEQLSSFGEDASGRVYVTSLNGPVYRLAAR